MSSIAEHLVSVDENPETQVFSRSAVRASMMYGTGVPECRSKKFSKSALVIEVVSQLSPSADGARTTFLPTRQHPTEIPLDVIGGRVGLSAHVRNGVFQSRLDDWLYRPMVQR